MNNTKSITDIQPDIAIDCSTFNILVHLYEII